LAGFLGTPTEDLAAGMERSVPPGSGSASASGSAAASGSQGPDQPRKYEAAAYSTGEANGLYLNGTGCSTLVWGDAGEFRRDYGSMAYTNSQGMIPLLPATVQWPRLTRNNEPFSGEGGYWWEDSKVGWCWTEDRKDTITQSIMCDHRLGELPTDYAALYMKLCSRLYPECRLSFLSEAKDKIGAAMKC
jgi:hypothetical protein